MNAFSRTAQAIPQPLQGVRIVDFTSVLAGPYCTYQLGLLGADVIKVERPDGGDFSRQATAIPGVDGLSSGYVAQNAGKRSITLDLKSPAGIDVALALIERCDAMVENFSPGIADRLGIGFEAAKQRNPKLVYASLSGYGQDGAYSARPAYDHVIQAISGITMLIGAPEAVPNRIGPPLFDYLAGIYGAFAVLAALQERTRTGLAQRIDLAMLDAGIVAMASTTSAWLNAGVEPIANGNTAASGSPASGIFETREGLLSLAPNQEHHVASLCAALGPPSLLDDARFATPVERKRNASAFGRALTARLAERSAEDWETLLSARHVPAVRVRKLPDILADPHLQTRQVQREVVDPLSGKALSVPSLGFKWNGLSIGPARPPARLGADTDAVLGEIGYDEGAILDLRQRGVV